MQQPVDTHQFNLLERDAELEQLAAAIERAQRGRGGLLLVEGEAGIGKTRLLEAACALAQGRDLEVLRARGGELERELAHGIVRQLFEMPIRAETEERRRTLLDGAAAAVAPLVGFPDAFGATASLSPEDMSFAIQHGVYWVAAAMAERAPLLICVDDVHWSDDASLRCLTYLARRTEGLAAMIIVAARTGEAGAGEELLRALRDAAQQGVLELAPLTAESSRRLVREQARHPVTDDVAESCWRAGGGNPFLLGELARTLTIQAPEDVERLSPPAVTRSILARLDRLPPEPRALASSVAVLGSDAAPHHARALSDLTDSEAIAATDALVAARVLHSGAPLRFIHPLLRTAVHDALPPASRSALHLRAARLIAQEDPESDRVAMHLLSADPRGDPWAVHHLRAASVRAQSRGAAEPAIAFARRALAEPPPAAERANALIELARAERSRDSDSAAKHLREALAATEDIEVRATAAGDLAMLMVGSEESVDVLEDVLRRLPPEAEGRDLLEAQIGVVAQFCHAHSASVAARLAQVRDDTPAETLAQRMLLAALSCARLLQCTSSGPQIAALAERAIEDGELLASQQAPSVPHGLALDVLTHTDSFDIVRSGIDAALADARARHSLAGMLITDLFSARLSYATGQLVRARDHASNALAGIADIGVSSTIQPILVASLIRPLVAMGELDSARNLLVDVPPTTLGTDLLLARSELHLASGDQEQAVHDALEVLRRRSLSLSGGTLPPVGWRSQAALALWANGDAEQAQELAAEEVEVAEQWDVPGALGAALRVQGLLAGGDAGLPILARAVAILESTERRLDLARALVDHGAALRRARHAAAAREPLRRGLDLATHCGAAPLALRAKEELLASGARPRRPAITGRDALTASEHRVATLAAEGMANRAIAQTLFVSPKTVEAHLRAVYRKLDIRSRHELPSALVENQGDETLAPASH